MNIVISRSIELLRVISILFVLILHAATSLNFSFEWVRVLADVASHGIGALGVPIFLVISGYLAGIKYADGGAVQTFSSWIRRAKGLLAGYVFWNTFVALVALLIVWSHAPMGSFLSSKLDGGWLSVYGLNDPFPIAYQFWFIRELLILSTIVFILERAATASKKLSIFIIFFLIVILLMKMTERTQISAISYIVGYLFGRNDLLVKMMGDRYKHRVWLIAMGVATLISLVITSVVKPWVDVALISFILFGTVSVIGGVIGMVSKGYRLDAMARWAPATFFIFAAHEPFLALVRKVLLVQLGPEFAYIMSPILILGSLMGLYFLIPNGIKVKAWFIFIGTPPK